MFVCGAIAAMSAAIAITAPAESALEPGGATYRITGTVDARNRLTIPRIEDESPPGVSRIDHDGVELLVLGTIDRVLDVLLRDGVDVVVEMNGENARRDRPVQARGPARGAQE